MKIITLVENTSISNDYRSKHGLSFYIETCGHKILFDLGSNHLFLENAKKLGVNISEIDIVIISHGHIDHGGALGLFLERNTHAKIYIRKDAFEKHSIKVFAIPFSIGLDPSLISHRQIVFSEEITVIDHDLILFSEVENHDFFPKSNRTLYKKAKQGYLPDNFSHEQSLIIKENQNTVLISGCGHCGILNIQKKGNTLLDRAIGFVVSGMHLYNPTTKQCESDDFIADLGEQLAKTEAKYFTCHCTGEKPMLKLSEYLGNDIAYLRTGSVLYL